MAEDYKSDYLHTAVSGELNQHARSYWRLALPAIGTRYIARYAQNLAGLKDNRFFDAVAGAWMLGVTAYYAYRSEEDLKRIFSETVAYEFDKKPSEIGIRDLIRSKNKAVIGTHQNFLIDNTLRTAVNSAFFACFLPGKRFQAVDSVDLGVGLNGAYMVYEILGHGNTTTFFAHLQHFLSSKIDQKNSMGDDVTAVELMQLYERYALDNDKLNALGKQADSKLWKQSNIIFEHMAELMNRTYQHKYNGEAANFIVPKFLYLLGHNLIQPKNPEQTLAYIDVANRYGMKALKEVVKSVNDGMELATALQQYPVPPPAQASQADKNQHNEKEETLPAGRKFADGINANGSSAIAKSVPTGGYTDKIAKSNGGACVSQ